MGDRPVGKIDQGRINLMLEDSFAHVAGATGNMRKTDVAFLRYALFPDGDNTADES